MSCGFRALEHRLSSCGTWVQLHNMWDLPEQGIEPVSTALVGGFFTTEPPGKPEVPVFFDKHFLSPLPSGLCPWTQSNLPAEAKLFSVGTLLSHLIRQLYLFRKLGCQDVGGCANSVCRWGTTYMPTKSVFQRTQSAVMSAERSVSVNE